MFVRAQERRCLTQASLAQTALGWMSQLPFFRDLYQRFVWFKPLQWATGPFAQGVAHDRLCPSTGTAALPQ
jgi:hypothetical protein